MCYKSPPFFILSSTSMILSTIMVISSTNWLYLWMALELNLLSFMPLILSTNAFQETEASVKYFMAQALGSSLLLISSMLMWYHHIIPSPLLNIILITSLLIKIGMAPCHLWYSSVMTSISWTQALLLSTWQKLAPIFILAFIIMSSSGKFLLLISTLNALTGGLMGLNQSHLRTILAYSSITHMGWMTALISLNKYFIAIMYFFLYFIIAFPIFLMMKALFASSMTNMNKFKMAPQITIAIQMLMLSLGGMPPLTGFIPKAMTIMTLAPSMPFLIIILIMGSMMNMYYYLNLLMYSMVSSISQPSLLNKINMSTDVIIMFTIAIIGLPSLMWLLI